MPMGCGVNAGGVYMIVNQLNGNVYVGSTSAIRKRWVLHRHLLRQNKHHAPHLQAAWRLYGESAFQFVVVQVIDDPELRLKVEQCFIDVHSPERLYNVSRVARSNVGLKRSELTRAKMREGMKDPKRVAHIRALGKKPKSEEQRRLMSLAARKRGPHSEETKAKMRAAWVLRRAKSGR
jgi:group I intron endonuclease